MGMNMKKWAVLGGGVVIGIVVLMALSGGAFGGGTAAAPEPEPAPTSAAPAPTKTKAPKPDEPTDASAVALGLYNGTTESGLADKTARKMGSAYNIVQVGNTLEQLPITEVHFVKAKDQPAAEAIRDAEFPDADVTELDKGTQVSVDGTTEKISSDIQVVVFLGEDQVSG